MARKESKWILATQNWQSYLLIVPFFLLFFTFTVFSVLIAIGLSFTNFNMLSLPSFVGLDNYVRLFLEDEIFVKALRNTIIFAVVTGPLSYLLCFTFAWIINELPPKIRAFITVVFYAPSISGMAYMVWGFIFSGDRYGHVNGILIDLGLIQEPINFFRNASYILPILLVVQLWLSLGTGFLAFIAGLQTVDRSLYEAGAVDGVRNRWQELWFITLPSMKPQLMFGAVIQITTSFAISDISLQLAGHPSVNNEGATIVTQMIDFGTYRFEMGFACTIATLLFLIMIGLNKVIQRLLRKVGT